MSHLNIRQLLFRQKGKCYFCQKELSVHRADIEHLLAQSNAGPDIDENCVAVCKGANRLMANLPLKEKISIFRDRFVCPEESGLSYIEDSTAEIPEELADTALTYINRIKAQKLSRPARRNSLLNQLSSQFPLNTGEPEAIITLLVQQGYIHFDGSAVVWNAKLLAN